MYSLHEVEFDVKKGRWSKKRNLSVEKIFTYICLLEDNDGT